VDAITAIRRTEDSTLRPTTQRPGPDTARLEGLQRAFERSALGALVLDAENVIVYANQAFAAILGASREGLIGRPALELSPAGDDPHDRDVAAAVRAGELPMAWLERRVVRPDGGVLWLMASCARVGAPGDGMLGFVVHDVTARKAAHDRLQALVEAAPIAILTVAETGAVTFANAEAERLLGYEDDGLAGVKVEQLLPLRLRDGHEAQRAAYLRRPEMRPMGGGRDLYALHRDGHEVPVEVSLSPIAGEGVQVVMADITARKRGELQLRRHAGRQRAIAELGERALRGERPVELMQGACDAMFEYLDADFAKALEHDPAADGLVIRAVRGWEPELIGTLLEIDGTHAGEALRADAAVVVLDELSAARYPAGRLHGRGISSGISVAIGHAGDPLGVLSAHSRRARHFGEQDRDFIRSLANVLADAIRRERAEAATRHQALHDPLTGLPNRTLLADRMQHWYGGADRSATLAAALFVDIDHFKDLNDSLGHGAGDDLLVQATRRLRRAVRPGDTIARFGGDEFVVFCADLDGEHQALGIADRVRASFSDPFHVEGRPRRVSASVGLAISGRPPMDPDALLRNADSALYRAKARGRDRVESFSDELHRDFMRRVRTEQDLLEAIEAKAIDVHYQPVVDLASRRNAGFEALARWTHPVSGPVSPAEFIPIAEASGAIVGLGALVLEQAVRQAACWWPRVGESTTGAVVSVNLSPRQLAEPGAVELIARTLEAAGVPAAAMAFEVTETALLGDVAAARDLLTELRALGVRIVLDDFGTGYSSLSHVKRLPLDVLKIDRSFVREAAADPSSLAIVRAVLHLAEGIGATVVAEGVETEEQHELLLGAGCQYGQGFLYGRPAPSRELDPRVAPPMG
jgi:diguanylate cyclase (GGDEF)-like protein/PAS domain S-box-containing protein